MAVRATSPLAAFRWVGGACVDVVRAPPTAWWASLISFACVYASWWLAGVLGRAMPGHAGEALGMGLWMLALLATWPVAAGVFRVMHALQTQRPARATDVFQPYRDGGWKPVMWLALCVFALYLVAALSIGAWTGGASFGDMPSVIAGYVYATLMFGVCAVGWGQVAIARRPVIAAMRDAFVAVYRNVLPLLLLIVAGLALWFAWWQFGALVHKAIGWMGESARPAMAALANVATMVVVNLFFYRLAYLFWRDVCGDPPAPSDVVLAQV